ncbi:MAG TPA: tyrosine--tRNA ligase [Bryobacteraceae bacterium]|jgi:tyrosyl-tRNA synthetase
MESSHRLLDQLEQRGMIEQVTNRAALDELLSKPGQAIYVGFDPTADSLHVGHFLPVLMLARFQRAGHRPIVLVGGATGMIGDPSGRASERPLITVEDVARNSAAVREQLSRFVSFEGEVAAQMVDNLDWTQPVSYLEWLRTIGKHFTINYMMAKESVRRRLEDREQGISYTEFSYMLLQANDFLHLFDHHSCAIQAGGTDQWGNITAGTELIRKVRSREAFGITFPLLTTSSGEKFGKSAGNAIWLDPKRTSPYQFYQFWIRTDDRDVERLLRLFTFLEIDEINSVVEQHKASPDQRTAQKKLAEEMTRIVHGDAQLKAAMNASEALFGGEVSGLSDADLSDIFADVPSFTVTSTSLDTGIKIADVLVAAGAAKSKGEAQRLVQGGGVYINNKRIEGAATIVQRRDLASESMFVVRVGKKSYYLGRVA